MNNNRTIRHLFHTSILSLAGVALLTQTASASEINAKTGNSQDLQGVVSCNVSQNPWLAIAPLGELPCESPVGGPVESIAVVLEHGIMQLNDTAKTEIVYTRYRQDYPDALVVGDR